MNFIRKQLLLTLIFFVACKSEEPGPTSLILGEWTFIETSTEIVSENPDNITVQVPNPSDLTWTFLVTDSVLITQNGISYKEQYDYDAALMTLKISDSVYDVLELRQDSLKLRILTQVAPFSAVTIDFYIYYSLLRQ